MDFEAGFDDLSKMIYRKTRVTLTRYKYNKEGDLAREAKLPLSSSTLRSRRAEKLSV